MTVSRRAITNITSFFAIGSVLSEAPISEAVSAQPSIDVVLRSLYAARRGILTSLPRKDGHRGRALRHIEEAIVQLKLYMAP